MSSALKGKEAVSSVFEEGDSEQRHETCLDTSF